MAVLLAPVVCQMSMYDIRIEKHCLLYITMKRMVDMQEYANGESDRVVETT